MMLNPGDEVDYHALDCYSDMKDNLYISLQHRPVRKHSIVILFILPKSLILNIATAFSVSSEHEIDGPTLEVITERMAEQLIPVIRKQTLFMNLLDKLKGKPTQG